MKNYLLTDKGQIDEKSRLYMISILNKRDYHQKKHTGIWGALSSGLASLGTYFFL